MQEIQEMAQQFGVDAGALQCLIAFLQSNIAKNPQAFVMASDEQRDEMIKQGVQAWHRHSVRMLSELHEGKSEWAQEARSQIASDVWHQVRAMH